MSLAYKPFRVEPTLMKERLMAKSGGQTYINNTSVVESPAATDNSIGWDADSSLSSDSEDIHFSDAKNKIMETIHIDTSNLLQSVRGVTHSSNNLNQQHSQTSRYHNIHFPHHHHHHHNGNENQVSSKISEGSGATTIINSGGGGGGGGEGGLRSLFLNPNIDMVNGLRPEISSLALSLQKIAERRHLNSVSPPNSMRILSPSSSTTATASKIHNSIESGFHSSRKTKLNNPETLTTTYQRSNTANICNIPSRRSFSHTREALNTFNHSNNNSPRPLTKVASLGNLSSHGALTTSLHNNNNNNNGITNGRDHSPIGKSKEQPSSCNSYTTTITNLAMENISLKKKLAECSKMIMSEQAPPPSAMANSPPSSIISPSSSSYTANSSTVDYDNKVFDSSLEIPSGLPAIKTRLINDKINKEEPISKNRCIKINVQELVAASRQPIEIHDYNYKDKNNYIKRAALTAVTGFVLSRLVYKLICKRFLEKNDTN